MAKKRIFYLDFIRVISMLIIVTYHFAVHFPSDNISFINFLSDGRFGLIGVAIFFMISGASLMYNYGEKIDLKTYYKKRFLGIYPMFWIAYSLVFLYIFYQSRGFFTDLPIYKLGISFLGMDGYLSTYTSTFYLIGEWFIGCIIIIYILFPLLRIAMKKYPKAFLAIATVLNFAVLSFSNFKIPINQNLIVCMYGFLLGMYFIEYVQNCKWYYAAIAAVISVCLFMIKLDKMCYIVLVSNIIGYSLFVVLCYIGSKIKWTGLQNIVNILSKYSYAIFLLHHYIIMKITSAFPFNSLEKYGSLCVYLICWVLIGIFSKALYELNKKVIPIFTPSSKGN